MTASAPVPIPITGDQAAAPRPGSAGRRPRWTPGLAVERGLLAQPARCRSTSRATPVTAQTFTPSAVARMLMRNSAMKAEHHGLVDGVADRRSARRPRESPL